MTVSITWKDSGALKRRLKEVSAQVDPRSGRMDRFRYELAKIAKEDNTEKLLGYGSALAGIDRFGRPLAPLGKWATGRAYDRRGHGPVLAPHGLASRIITRFKVAWQWTGKQFKMLAGWRDLPWMIYHLEGRKKGDHPLYPEWQLPQRQVDGLSPKGWIKARAAFSKLAKSIARKGGSSSG